MMSLNFSSWPYRTMSFNTLIQDDYRGSEDNIGGDISTRDFQHIFFDNEVVSPELFNIGLNSATLFYLSLLMDWKRRIPGGP